MQKPEDNSEGMTLSSMRLSFWARMRITAKHREQWYLSLAKLARDGVPLFDAIQSMHQELAATRHPLAPLLSCVMLGLRGAPKEGMGGLGANGLDQMGLNQARGYGLGASDLSRGLVMRPTLARQLMGLVPEHEAMLIQAGDVSARLELGLENAAKLLISQAALHASVRAALLKPVTYLLCLFALLIDLSWEIFPQFEAVIPKANWSPGFAKLAYCADHLGAVLLAVLMGLTLFCICFDRVLHTWIHPWREGLDRRVFPFNWYATLMGSYFLTALSGFIDAGLPFSNSIQSIRACSSPYLKHQCDMVLMALKRGDSPARALTQVSIISRSFHWLIMVYAVTSDSTRAYVGMAEQMRTQVERNLKFLFGDVLGALMLAGIGVVIYWIYAQMMSGLI